MQIAICDDQYKECKLLIDFLGMYRPQWKCTYYDSGEEFIDAIEDEKVFHLVFLDIYMKQLDGMDTAKALRKRNKHIAIVFVTTSRDFAVESYQVSALSYLVKPLSAHALIEVIERFEVGYRPQYIAIGNKLCIASEVVYMESCDKKVLIHFVNGKVEEIRGKLGEIENTLVGSNFLRCHRSYIINMDNVNKVDGGFFLMSTRALIPMRRQEVAKYSHHYYQYITN